MADIYSVPLYPKWQENTIQKGIDAWGQQLGQAGPTPDFDIVPQAGPLSQQLQQQAGGLIGQSGQAMGQFGQPLTAQAMQQGSQPFLDSLMSQFQGQVVPDIAGQFGALGAARSSGLGDAIGRQASQLPGQAQNQFLNQRNMNFQQGMQGMQLGGQVASQQDLLNQLFSQGQFQKWGMGQQGQHPLVQQLMSMVTTPTYENIAIGKEQGTDWAGGLMGMGGSILGGMASGGMLSGGLIPGLGKLF